MTEIWLKFAYLTVMQQHFFVHAHFDCNSM